jgi:UDP-glucose 4-epimerase
MKRVLITGANSYVGTHVSDWLLKTPDQFQVDTVDAMNDAWKQANFTKYDVVYHVAGIAHVDAKKSMEPLYYKVNRDLSIEIATHAKEHGVKQFIFMSSMIVYGESKSLKPMVITKETKPCPNGFYGNSKLQAEEGLRKLEDKDFKVVILRPPMIYGPGCKGNFPRLIKLAAKLPICPNYHNQRSMLYIDNLCEFIKILILKHFEGTFFPQNDEYSDTVELIKQLAKLQRHRIYFCKSFNYCIMLGSFFSRSINKLFTTDIYIQGISNFELNYSVVSLNKSLCKMVE